MDNNAIEKPEKKKTEEEVKEYKETSYDEAVNKVGLRARKEIINNEIKEGYNTFKSVNDWNGARDSEYERLKINNKTTSLTFYDVNVKYLDDNGNLKEEIADIYTVSVLYKGEPLSDFNRKLGDDKENYSIVIEFEVEDQKHKKIFNYDRLNLSVKREATGCRWVTKDNFIWDKRDISDGLFFMYSSDEDKAKSNLLFNTLLVKNKFDPDRTYNRYEASGLSPERWAEVFGLVADIEEHTSGMNNLFGNMFGAPQEKDYSKKHKPSGKPAFDQLDELIGMESIKKDVKDLANFVQMQEKRKKQGLKTVPVSRHLVFTGNPGTGKTTVARIIASIYKEIGVLSKGHMIETDRSSLVASYVGQTAPKTMEKIREAKGGVLFIDEAYTLAKDADKDFGQEAIDTLLKAMEDGREDFVVIVAGYPDLMRKFIKSNPGLESRFNKYIHFPDYNEDELYQIMMSMCGKYEYRLEPDADEILKDKIKFLLEHKGDNFANARTIRNMFETMITNQSTRLASIEASSEEMQLIRKEDVERL